MKPHAEIRKALVEGIRNSPEKSKRLKNAAERWISVIDEIASRGDSGFAQAAFHEAHANFIRIAGNEPFPPVLSPEEIAKAFGLGEGEGA